MSTTPLLRRRQITAAAQISFVAWTCAGFTTPSWAQDTYRTPPAQIVRILEAPPTPTVSLNPQRTLMVLIERESMPPIAELAKPMDRLAGARLNPKTNGPFTTSRNIGLTVKRIDDGSESKLQLKDVPASANIGFPTWSPDGKRFAFTVTLDNGVELWCCDGMTGSARRLTGANINAAFGPSYDWMPDSKNLICRVIPVNRPPAPTRPEAPAGPVIQQTERVTAPVRTFQDLLKDAHDEALFEHYMTAQIVMVDSETGRQTNLNKPAMYNSINPSPSGKLLLVSRTVRPYSYLVTAGSFPEIIELWDQSGNVIREVAKLPLRDNVPIEGVPTGPRGFTWQSNSNGVEDVLYWIEALDGGDPKNKVPHRDRVMRLAGPFNQTTQASEVLKIEHRFRGMTWMQTPHHALVRDYDRDRRWMRTFLVDLQNPNDMTNGCRLLWDRSINDRYGDPGAPIMTTTSAGRSVALVHNHAMYLEGSGATPEGDRPFLDRIDLRDLSTQRLWRCEGQSLESVADILNPDATQILTRYETPNDPPNYFIRNLADKTARQLTHFEDPAVELRGIRKQLVTYDRDDGVKLSATLYLPADYQEGQRLPLIVWAYPREFNDADTAGQVSGSPFRFTRIEGISHLFLLTQGYAIMDNATMPVVGDPETMNDTFLSQIVASARACIEKAASMGVADPQRVGVGGHSYGAFMTANLLAHCDLFKAGVARSGAYNRTLTPFGFQSERRTLWDAPRPYIELSPFMVANKINEPLLMIHGQMDDNPGTFPMQSERLYQAIKGNGGHARLVMLPYESHGYRAKESVMHTLAEMIEWFDTHVKYAPGTSAASSGASSTTIENAEQ